MDESRRAAAKSPGLQIQCAQVAKRYSPYLNAFHESVKCRRGGAKAKLGERKESVFSHHQWNRNIDGVNVYFSAPMHCPITELPSAEGPHWRCWLKSGSVLFRNYLKRGVSSQPFLRNSAGVFSQSLRNTLQGKPISKSLMNDKVSENDKNPGHIFASLQIPNRLSSYPEAVSSRASMEQ